MALQPPIPCAVLDACVLYPAPLRDLFMHLAVTGAFQARWSEDIHTEWIRNVLENRPDLTAAQLARTRELMNAYAESSLVTSYEHLIPSLHLPDLNDRHVLAAAIVAEAKIIVTLNLRDFPAETLSAHEVTTQRPDDFLCDLFHRDPARVCMAVRTQRAQLKNPPKNIEQHLATLVDNGLLRFVELLRPHHSEL